MLIWITPSNQYPTLTLTLTHKIKKLKFSFQIKKLHGFIYGFIKYFNPLIKSDYLS